MVSYFIYFLSYSRFTMEKGSLDDTILQLKRHLKVAEPLVRCSVYVGGGGFSEAQYGEFEVCLVFLVPSASLHGRDHFTT
jgi:hypothetical protein